MKSLTAVCQQTTTSGGTTSMPPINSSGRVSRPTHPHRGDGENAEMKMYLSKLKDLVPFMPKNRKLSKLEIIQHVIDYICDLQSELETHPEISSFDAAAALNLNGVAQHLAAAAGDDDSNNEDNSNNSHPNQDEDVASSYRDDNNRLSHDEILQHNRYQTSPPIVVRQPLAARQSPNTILPASHQLSHYHQTLYPASTVHLINNGITNSQLSSAANEVTDQQKQISSSSSSRQQC